jgi:hypothetical protein
VGTRPIAAIAVAAILLSGCASPSGISDQTAQPEENSSEVDPAPASPYFPELSPKFSNPWPADVTRVELVNSALFNSLAFLDTKQATECGVRANTFSGTPLQEEHKPLLEQLSNRLVLTFCDYLVEDFYVLGGNYDFVEQTISSEQITGDFYKGCSRPANEFASACAYDGVAWIGISLGSQKRGEVFLEERRLTIAAHEIFHVVHDQIDPGPGGQIPPRGNQNFRPVWLIEGAGEFFGRLMPYYFEMIDSYGTFIPTDRSGLFLDKNYLGDLELMEIRQNNAFGTENYYSGQIAMEYIIASIGMEALLDIWVEMGKGRQFDEAFSKVTGLSTQEFYEKFLVMHGNLYDGELATN